MALVKCLGCDTQILTESEPHLIVPHATGYHPFCFDCTGFEMRVYYNKIKEKIPAKTEEGETIKRATAPE